MRRRFLGLVGGFALSPIALGLVGCGGGDGQTTQADAQDGLGSDLSDGCSKTWNTVAKLVVVNVVRVVGNSTVAPGVGTFSGAMVNALWPSCGGTPAVDDVLNRAQIVDVVNETNAKTALTDVQGHIATYKSDLAAATTDDQKRAAFQTCFDAIESQDAIFQPAGDEISLLPLFVLYGNLFLSVAADAIYNASKWGFTTGSPYLIGGQLFLNRAVPYVNQIYEYSYQIKLSDTGVDYHACEPFRTANTERTRLNLDALDLVSQWPLYLTPPGNGNPNDPRLIPQREVFYGPYGTGDDSGMITLPLASATGLPLSMTVMSGERLDSVRVTYAAGAGPDGVTDTPQMGGTGGGATPVANANTIASVSVWSGDIVNGIQFTYSNGNTTSLLGQTSGNAQPISSAASLLSSVYINGVSGFYGSADTFVVGFMLDPTQFKPS